MKDMISTSLFSFFKVGPGPSSSHTIGPMAAACRFRREVAEACADAAMPCRVSVRLFGSLSATGLGHGTDFAIVAGLLGHGPEDCPPGLVPSLSGQAEREYHTEMGRVQAVVSARDVVHDAVVHGHPYSNTMTFVLEDREGRPLLTRTYYSVGGGFVQAEGEAQAESGIPAHPYASMSGLQATVAAEGMNIYEIMLDNEMAISGMDRPSILHALNDLLERMDECVARGLRADGRLPGPLGVSRKAGMLLERAGRVSGPDAFVARLGAYSFAAAEENAAGGVVVTAPTCGSAGVLPAIVRFMRHDLAIGDRAIREGFLAAAAVGFVAKHNASISGAEVGCQGEIGVASAMAAAMLTDARGNHCSYVENAAETALEHHLGLTCDPVGGYVQIPCIERNAMGSLKAYAASVYAVSTSRESHRVSFDAALSAMRETGMEMSSKFKETSLGGLAVSMVAC